MKLPLLSLVALLLSAAEAPLAKLNEAGYAKLIGEQKGKVVLVDFWATWCTPCRKEMPLVAKLEARLKARGFRVITVSSDELENEPAARAFLKDAGITGSTYIKAAKNDDAFIRQIDPKWGGELPALVLYDRTGKKVKMWKGETAIADIEAAVAKLL
ncbi:MAG: TlpA disulfide reductase family protein [Acidobacteria bacterium]|jgi:thiol-disulfide isomerase/thioredoxin|nr:TlpA disulfide reductase family protein [Acidobacteriota bacterium]